MDENGTASGQGSALLGFGIAWAVAATSSVAAWIIGYVWQENLHSNQIYNESFLLAGVLPPLALLALLAGCFLGGRRQLAQGVLAAFGSMFALVLLLVAACFGAFGLDAF